MRYLRVFWHHDFDDEPVELWSEIGDDDFEVRKVEVYRDGRMDYADADNETGETGLAQVETPSVDEIALEPEFDPTEIDAAAFERIWQAARAYHGD